MKRWNAIAAQAALAVALFAIVPASFAEQPAGDQGPQPETEMMGPGMGRGMMGEEMMGPGMMGQGMGRGGMMGMMGGGCPMMGMMMGRNGPAPPLRRGASHSSKPSLRLRMPRRVSGTLTPPHSTRISKACRRCTRR